MQKSKKKKGVPAHRLFTIDIVGPFLDNPFRRLATATSARLPGWGCTPVGFGLFIIQTEQF
jgi:hypothetical protein